MTQFHRSTRVLRNPPPRRRRPSADNLFAWTLFIVLLAVVTLFSWMGSFYVFGHPEKRLSYSLLQKFGKIDQPERFKLTSAPRGKFLTAEELHTRFGSMPKGALQEESDLLVRNYIRNFQQTKDPVTYVVGDFRVMGAFRLDKSNFFQSGVVALAESADTPSVLLEMVFPAQAESTHGLEQILQTGMELKLVKTLDLAAIIGARKLPDGRLSLTAVPLTYGHYTSSSARGLANLDPPETLNVGAGLPILNQAAVDAADQNFRDFAQRTGLVRKEMPAVLMRVQQTEAAKPTGDKVGNLPVLRAIPVEKSTPSPTPSVEPSTAAPEEAEKPIPRAIPVTPEKHPAPAETPTPTPAPTPSATPSAPTPSPSPTPAAGRAWALHDPGRMPRGRLVDLEGVRGLAGQNLSEKTYLRGDFNVSAAGPGRAVLRSRRGGRDMRVIVAFPAGATVPTEGGNFTRDNQRPFEITSVEQGSDGQVNVYVREVTRP